MKPGTIQGLDGRRCLFLRTVEKSGLKDKFGELLKSLFQEKKKDGAEPKAPSFSSFRKVFGRKFESTFKLIHEEGTIEKENSRTVWIRFGYGQCLGKFKKCRVEAL